jgi:hypothetical protein
LDLAKIDRIKTDPTVIDELLAEHYQTHGRRVYHKTQLPIVREHSDELDHD